MRGQENEIEYTALTAAQCAARKSGYDRAGDDGELPKCIRDMPRRALNLASKREFNRRKLRLYGFED